MVSFRSRCFPVLLIAGAVALMGCNRTQSAPTPAQVKAQPSASSPAPVAVNQAASAAESSAPDPTPSRPSGPIRFTDVTAQAGIHFKYNSGAYGKKLLPETMGPGVCVIDYDNDGWSDILFVNSMDWPGHKIGKSYPALYHNNHDGTFTDVTRKAGLAVEMYGLGVTVGDYDNDGHDDILITALGQN